MNDLANPCGLIAKNYFLDSYILETLNDSVRISINESHIANPNDKEYMFKRNSNFEKDQWIDVEDEHFMVWMSMMSFKDFRKRWGRIDQNLNPGIYNLTIINGMKVYKIFFRFSDSLV